MLTSETVFLRMLEYYNGVLFLTTNRVMILDEVVKSRILLHLRYSQLDKGQTTEIFKHNISRLKKIELRRQYSDDRLQILESDINDFARTHFDETAKSGVGRWNGRQIQNAFQIAASLAHLDGDDNPGQRKVLKKSHFDTVAQTIKLYDSFRTTNLGQDDSEYSSYTPTAQNEHENYVGAPVRGEAWYSDSI